MSTLKSKALPRPSSKSPKKRYHHGNLRETLVDAAQAIVVEQGPRELTLRAVARRAGVSHTAPYRHFDYKESLLAAVAERGFLALETAMRAAMAQAPAPQERFQASGRAYIEYAVAQAAHYRLMFGPELAGRLEFPEMADASRKAFAVLEEGLTECQQAGLVHPGSVRDYALSTWSLLHGFAMLSIDGQFKNKGYGAKKLQDLMGVAAGILFTGLRAA
jgi:AcrR family transcriptional regulator